MSYILGTTETTVRWYKFKFDKDLQPGQFELLNQLIIGEVPAFSDKQTAKEAAKALGLETWRYFSY